jgi:hypothetical protein
MDKIIWALDRLSDPDFLLSIGDRFGKQARLDQ